MSEAPALGIRLANEDDLKFVRASWFESFKQGGYAPQVAFPTYRSGQDAIIERCLAASWTYVAYSTAVPDEVCGWVCLEGTKLHYVYTKLVYRRHGIAIALLLHACNEHKSKPTEHTHDTRVGRSFTAKMGTKLNPYSLYNYASRSKR